MSTPVTPNDFSEIRWRGHWIWTEPPAMPSGPFSRRDSADERAEAHGLFRKRFVLEQVPERAPARVTADGSQTRTLAESSRGITVLKYQGG